MEEYNCDIRGWTRGITASRDTSILFSESIRFEDPQMPGATALFSGNISEIETVQRGNPKDIYTYSYDEYSRLTDARHFIGGPAGASNTNTERFMEYDMNGNLTSLQRYGDSPSDCSTLLFGYTGNRLTAADKIGSRIIWMYNFGYDLNGNRTSDSRTGLEFTYNLLNLPCEVRDSQDNMKMRYTYLSDGTKVSALDAAGDGLLYRGNFVYEKDGQNISLESIAWDEGRIRRKVYRALHYDEPVDVVDTLAVIDTLPGIPWHPKEPFIPTLLAEEGHWVEADTTELVLGPAIDREPLYQDQWFVRDHLGNVRSVIDLTRSATMPADSVILEQNNYLPYGTKSSTSSLSTDSAFRYRYAGKEEQRFGAFDSQLLDFGARYYDPWSCQWTAVDPKGEDYVNLSPYVYCECEPQILFDPDGENPLAGAILGATIDYATQVASNYLSGQEKPFQNIDKKSIIVSAAAGAVGVGLASGIKKAAQLGSSSKKIVGALADMISSGVEDAIGQYAENKSIDINEVGVSMVLSAGSSAKTEKVISSSQTSKTLSRNLDRVERLAENSSSASRQNKLIEAKEALEKFENKVSNKVSSTVQFVKGTIYETREKKQN